MARVVTTEMKAQRKRTALIAASRPRRRRVSRGRALLMRYPRPVASMASTVIVYCCGIFVKSSWYTLSGAGT
jgi:uncharacterized membrane protein (UPF0182 family)